MGYLREIGNSEYAANDTALWNRMNGNDIQSPLEYIFSTNSPQIISTFGNLTMKIFDKGEKSEDSVSDKDAVKREALENEKADLLASLECESIDEFNGILNTYATDITNKQGELTTQKTAYETSKQEYGQKLNALNEEYTSGQITSEEYSQRLEELKKEEAELEKAEQEIQTKETELQELNKEYQAKQTKMQKVVDIQRKIDTLDNGGVKEKTSGMKEFTKALEKWQNAGSNDDKKALAEAAIKAFDDLQNNKDIKVPQSVIQLYKLYDQDLNNDVNGKREDLYK